MVQTDGRTDRRRIKLQRLSVKDEAASQTDVYRTEGSVKKRGEDF